MIQDGHNFDIALIRDIVVFVKPAMVVIERMVLRVGAIECRRCYVNNLSNVS